MIALLKKDFSVHTLTTYMLIALIILILSIITLPAFFVTFICIFALVLSLYSYDAKNKVDRVLISLPVTRTQMVKTRYLFAVLIAGFVVLFQAFIQQIYVMFLPGFPYVYDWQDFFVFFCLALVISATFIPILYFFDNLFFAIALVFLLLTMGAFFTIDALVKITGMTDEIIFNDLDKGFILLVEKLFPFTPLLFALCCSIILFWLSMQISLLIFKKKDV